MPDIDPAEYANPRRTVRRRMEEAGADDPGPLPIRVRTAAQPASAPAVRFEKGSSAEERAAQQRKLIEALKKRGY